MNKANFKVRAAVGLRVPYETKPRKYITEGAEVTVPATAYYLRRLADGELLDQGSGAQEVVDTLTPAITVPKGKTKTMKGA